MSPRGNRAPARAREAEARRARSARLGQPAGGSRGGRGAGAARTPATLTGLRVRRCLGWAAGFCRVRVVAQRAECPEGLRTLRMLSRG